jgi:hypothetical protein
MNFQKILLRSLDAALVVAAWQAYRWPGIAFV